MKKLTLEAAAGVYSGTAHDPEPHIIHIERNKAFKAGAEWQRTHVWHSINELPERGKQIIVYMESGNFTSWFSAENISDVFKKLRVKKWAYVESIFPNEERRKL